MSDNDLEQSEIVEHQEPVAVAPEAPKAQIVTLRDTQATSFLDPNLYIQMKALAADFIASKAIPTCWQSASQVLVGLQTGVEMGMGPMEAMNSLYVVNGAINVWGKAITRRFTQHGWTISYDEPDDNTCIATIKRGKEKYTEKYTYEMADASGYTGGGSKIGWRAGTNRKLKLRYGALNMLVRSYVPDVLGSATGIVEISEDIDDAPSKEELRKEKIAAAEAKRKELDAPNFIPGAVEKQ